MMLFLIYSAAILGNYPTELGTAECAIIHDHDERMMCYALETKSSSYCSFIKQHDKRAMCRALTEK